MLNTSFPGRASVSRSFRRILSMALRPVGRVRRRRRTERNKNISILAELTEPVHGGSHLALETLATALTKRDIQLHIRDIRPKKSATLHSHIAQRLRSYSTLVSRVRDYDRFDAVLFQHGSFRGSIVPTAISGVPIIYSIADMSNQASRLGRLPDLTLCASHAIRNNQEKIGESLVLHPLVRESRLRTEARRGHAVMQVNLNQHKGGELFYKLAERMPDVQFIGVKGGWGDQFLPDRSMENLEILEFQDDLIGSLRRAFVLLNPSRQEGYGVTPLEAFSLGIPVIAHPSPGTIEALADAAMYCDRQDVEAWVFALRSLADPDEYRRRSSLSVQRFQRHQWIVDDQLDKLEETLRSKFGRR
jgi:glycosyltransferase involved in cell wall biosynthesis